MGEMVAVNELLRKRKLLVSDLVMADQRVTELREQIRAIETVLTLLGHDGALPAYPARRPTFPIFARGEISKAARELQRTRPELRMPQQIAREIIAMKDWDRENAMLLGRVARAVKDYRKRRGEVRITPPHSAANTPSSSG